MDPSARVESLPAATRTKMRSEDDIQVFLIENVTAMAEMRPEEVDIDAALADYGIDSAQIVELTGLLCEYVGETLSDSIAWEYPTIRELSMYLGGAMPGERRMPEEVDPEYK